MISKHQARTLGSSLNPWKKLDPSRVRNCGPQRPIHPSSRMTSVIGRLNFPSRHSIQGWDKAGKAVCGYLLRRRKNWKCHLQVDGIFASNLEIVIWWRYWEIYFQISTFTPIENRKCDFKKRLSKNWSIVSCCPMTSMNYFFYRMKNNSDQKWNPLFSIIFNKV